MAIPEYVLVLMTSRSGSSMICDTFIQHGYYWSRSGRNQLVGTRRSHYLSNENQNVKEHLKSNFGIPKGDMVTFDDQQLSQFHAVLKYEFRHGEIDQPEFRVWKGASEFFPLWNALHEEGHIKIMPVVVIRPMEKVAASLLAKQRAARITHAPQTNEILTKRYNILYGLASDYAFPIVESEELIEGNRLSLALAFDAYHLPYDDAIAARVIKPKKWEQDR